MSNPYISKRYSKEKTTAMGKSDELSKSFDDIINLSLGDPDLITDSRIIEAAFEDAKKGHTKYTEFRGDPELRKEIAQFYKEDYDMDISDEEIFVCTSACEGMYLVLEAVLDDGDEVIVPAPYFTPYVQQVELARGVAVELPTYEDEGFQINTERMEALITEKTKALILNNPNNPTGTCMTMDTLKKIAQVAEKHDLLVIADEIYTAYCYNQPFVPFASFENMRKRTITINSFSKNFIMTGWRVGNIVADADIIDVIRQINDNVVFTAPSISQRAALFALKHRKEIQPAIVEEYRKRMYYAAERINNIEGFSVTNPPEGTFYLFANIKGTGLTSQEVADLILKEAHVLVLPGDSFGKCGEGYIRIACTCGTKVLGEAFDRIEKMSFSQKKNSLHKNSV